jgi:mono/diheme cytochrome c family protein
LYIEMVMGVWPLRSRGTRAPDVIAARGADKGATSLEPQHQARRQVGLILVKIVRGILGQSSVPDFWGGRMARSRLILATGLIATSAISGAHAQEQGDARNGLAVARHTCAACHAVEPGRLPSPQPNAPDFRAIAAVPGMSAAALRSSLHSSHRSMPNLILAPDELSDVVAYILSLK